MRAMAHSMIGKDIDIAVLFLNFSVHEIDNRLKTGEFDGFAAPY